MSEKKKCGYLYLLYWRIAKVVAKVGVKVATLHAGLLPWPSESKYQWLTYIGKSKQLLYANQNFFTVLRIRIILNWMDPDRGKADLTLDPDPT